MHERKAQMADLAAWTAKHAPRMPGTVAGVASERDLLVLQANGDANRLVALLDGCGVSGNGSR